MAIEDRALRCRRDQKGDEREEGKQENEDEEAKGDVKETFAKTVTDGNV